MIRYLTVPLLLMFTLGLGAGWVLRAGYRTPNTGTAAAVIEFDVSATPGCDFEVTGAMPVGTSVLFRPMRRVTVLTVPAERRKAAK